MKKITFYITALTLLISTSQAISQTVKIGNETWMSKNLNVDKFRNGDVIPEAKTDEEWENAGNNSQPAWCYFKNDPKNGEKYGKIYNWYAVNDPRGLAPKGWHVASKEEFEFLTYLNLKIDEKLEKSSFWEKDSRGFLALPGGNRSYCCGFSTLGTNGYWWSSTNHNTKIAWGLVLSFKDGNVTTNYPDDWLNNKREGFYVRCVLD